MQWLQKWTLEEVLEMTHAVESNTDKSNWWTLKIMLLRLEWYFLKKNCYRDNF